MIVRINDILSSNTTDQTFTEFHNFVFAFVNRANPNPVCSAAIFFLDDHVLRYVHEFTSHVTGVSRLERRISKTFACAVS